MRRLILLIMLHLCSIESLSQSIMLRGDSLVIRVVEYICRELDEEDSCVEDFTESITDYYNSLLRRPMLLNRARENELKSLMLLSENEVATILTERRECGEIRSFAQLMLLPGLDSIKLELLKPFISFEPDEPSAIDFKNLRGRLLFRGSVTPEQKEGFKPISKEEYMKRPESRYLGNPLYLKTSLSLDAGKQISLHMTGEKDQGERGFDYLSLSLCGNSVGFAERVVLGSFTARYGQGLALWNALHISSAWGNSSLIMRGRTVAPYTSADENRAFKGLAAELTFGLLYVNVWLSSRKIDAITNSEGYTSLQKTGLHNTLLTKQRRRSLGTSMAAVNTGVSLERFKWGVMFAADRKDLPYSGKNDLIKYLENRSKGVSLIASTDWYYINKSISLYGEAAYNRLNTWAITTGLSKRDKSEREYNLKYRYVHPHYYSPLSEIYKLGGNAVHALDLSFKREWSGRDLLLVNCSITEKRMKISLSSIVNINTTNKIELRGAGDGEVFYLRADYKYLGIKDFVLFSRADIKLSPSEIGSKGGSLYFHQEVSRIKQRLRYTVRVAWFNVSNWQLRLYAYERDLTGLFRTQLIYGKGLRAYFLLDFKILGEINFALKVSSTLYTHISKIGEGPEQISGPSKSEIKIQIRVPFR